MGEEDLAPVLLVEVLVLDGPLGDLVEVRLPRLVHLQQLQLLLDHRLQVPHVRLALLPLGLQLVRQLLVDLRGAVLALADLVALAQEDGELLAEVGELLLEVVLALVVEDLVGFVAQLQVQQHLLLGDRLLEQLPLALELLLQDRRPAPRLGDLLLVLAAEDAQLLDLLLSGRTRTFSRWIFSSRSTRSFFISSYLRRTSVRLWCAELYSPSFASRGYTRSLCRSLPVRKLRSACLRGRRGT